MFLEKQSIDIDNEYFAVDQPHSIPFIEFWKNYVNFGYYLFLVPFRIVKNSEGRRLEVRTNRVQKILCGVFQSMIFFQYLSLAWFSSRNLENTNQMSYFNSFCYFGYIAYHLALNYTFWCKKNAFKLVFDHMQKLRFYDQQKQGTTVLRIKAMSFSISVIAFIMGLTDIYLINNLYNHRNPSRFFNDLYDRAKSHFLFMDETTENISRFREFLLNVLTVIQVIILIPSVVLVPYLDLFVLMVPMCVRRIMIEFRQYCKNSMGSPMAAERILTKYATFKKFVKNLNRAMGIMFLACVSVSLPYYAAWIGVSFFESNVHPIMLIHVYAFFFIFFLALSMAADINKKGIEFFCWISSQENSEVVSSKTVSSLLMDLHSNQIALRGCAFFVITYRFLGTIFGVIVTYSIITIQLQFTRRANTIRSMGMDPQRINDCICNSTSDKVD